MRTRTLRVLAFLVVFMIPAAVSAQWALDGNPVCTATGAQDGIDITANGLAGAVMVWQDARGGATTDIYARQVHRLGGMEWTANGVALCTAANGQINPRVVHDGFGYLLYLWEDYRGGSADLYGAVTDRLGNVFTAANGFPICTAAGAQQYAVMASNESYGLGYAAWTDARSGNNDIYIQGFNVYNLNFWAAGGMAMCTNGSDQVFPAITANLPYDGVIVAWQDFRDGNYDIYAQRANLSAAPAWTSDGVAVCKNAGAQINPMIVSDGVGGAIIAWKDGRHGSLVGAIYAQRIDAFGNALWTAGGVPIVISTDLVILPRMVPDGQGGAVIVWEDDRNIATTGPDIYAQRVNASGAVQWTLNGVAVCTAPFAQSTSDVTLDGSTVVIAWQDLRVLGPANVYAQRLNMSGVPQWMANGIPVCTAAGNQFNVRIKQAENGAVIAAWEDRRTGGVADVYAQRIDTNAARYGYPAPYITSIVDVPNDEGGWVRLTFRPGDGDVPGMEYEIYNNDYHGGDLVDLVTGDGSGSYTRDVLTVGVGVPNSYWVFSGYYSNTVAGTSLDNIAPPAPTLSGSRNGNDVNLSWNSTASDIGSYSLERVGTGVIATPGTTSYTDVGAPLAGLTYRVRAVDIHGNAGAYSNDLVIATPTGVGDTPAAPKVLTLLPNSPNPFSASTALRFGTPSPGEARLEVFDVAGRRVALRDLGRVPAGWHNLTFDGRNDSGQPLASGVYFCRIQSGGETHTRRMVITR